MTPVGSFVVEPDHPSLAGHFPGRPVVPGVMLLDRALLAILAATGGRAASLPSIKFTRPVLPGQSVDIACTPADGNRIAFTCSVAGAQVARGSLVLEPAP